MRAAVVVLIFAYMFIGAVRDYAGEPQPYYYRQVCSTIAKGLFKIIFIVVHGIEDFVCVVTSTASDPYKTCAEPRFKCAVELFGDKAGTHCCEQ
jgi:hypothetical protein